MSKTGQSTDLGKDQHSLGTIFEGSGATKTPDRAITNRENASLQELALNSLGLDDCGVPFRPSYGKAASSNSIHLWTNYFQLTVAPGQKIYRYHAAIHPEIPSARKRRQLFKNAFEDVPQFRQLGHDLATDYKAIIVTAKPLELGDSYTRVFKQKYHEDLGKTTHANASEYEITISLSGDFLLENLTTLMNSTPTNLIKFNAKENLIQALNIIMTNHPNRQDGVFQSGQNRFFRYLDEEAYPGLDLGGGLIAVRGYYSSVRCATSRILLNLNAQCSPFYKAVNLADLMNESLGHVKQWRAVENFIEGVRIKIPALECLTEKDDFGKNLVVQERIVTVKGLAYMREPSVDQSGKQTRDRIGKLEWLGPPERIPSNARDLRFPCPELLGKTLISVEEYYNKKYGYRINYADKGFYVINCGTVDNPSWIPAELGVILPGQAYHRKLDETQTSNMLNIAAVPPGDNARRIVANDGGLGMIGVLPRSSSKSHSSPLTPFGIQIDENLLVVEARILQPPMPVHGNKKSPRMFPGSWSTTGYELAVPKPLPKWAVMTLGSAVLGDKQLAAFKKAFKEAGLEYEDSFCNGIRPVVTKPSDDASLGKMFGRLEEAGIRLLLVILPSQDKALYARLKTWADLTYGIHTVCVQHSRIKNESTKADLYANVTLKVNLKCGGTNHVLRRTDMDILSKGETMIVGMDVTHPASEHMTKAPSIAAVVSSIDADFGQWPASVRCQPSKQEIIEELEHMMIEHLTLWMSNNQGRKPKNILIYRDGVSEGQYTQVQEKELDQVRAACDFIYESEPGPKITIVVVGKRHHTRFYPTTTKHADHKNGNNPLPGTVVDRGITMFWLWDFYLQPHAAIKGTARPAHYVVLLDEIKFKADQLEKITHDLCYLHGRAPKAVSIVPAVYYADLACTRARAYLAEYLARPWPRGTKFEGAVAANAPWKEGVHPRLKNSMWYS